MTTSLLRRRSAARGVRATAAIAVASGVLLLGLAGVANAADPPVHRGREAPTAAPHAVLVPSDPHLDHEHAEPGSAAREGVPAAATARRTDGGVPLRLGLEGAPDEVRVREAVRAWVDRNVPLALGLDVLCGPSALDPGAAPYEAACVALEAGAPWAAHVVDVSWEQGRVVIGVAAPLHAALGEARIDHLLETASGALAAPASVTSLTVVAGDPEGAPPEPVVIPPSPVSPPGSEGGGGLLPKSALRPEAGSLAGRRVALSPGHGLYWTGSRWATQRSDSFGLIEDYTTATMAAFHIDPYLRGAGADVVWVRERDRSRAAPRTFDVGSPEFRPEGAWTSATDGSGRPVRRADAGAEAAAVWVLPSIVGTRPVYARWSGGAQAAERAAWVVEHAGGASRVEVQARRGGPHWQYLGRYALDASSRVRLEARDAEGGWVEADAILIGTSTGAVQRGGAPSGSEGWRECARNYAEFSGAPAAVYAARASERDSDVVARPLWANRLGVDAYLSVHTNAAGGTGTETFMLAGSPTSGSPALRSAVHTRLIDEVRAYWNGAWVDRGQKEANFGELRELSGIPGALVEVAFHDRDPATGPDVDSLHSPRFRRIAGRALARGVVRYFDASTPFVPEPPTAVALRNADEGLWVDWLDDSAREGAGAATSWVIDASTRGRAFTEGWTVDAPPFLLPDVPPGEVVAVRVRGRNAGGTGLPSTVVVARHAGGQPAPVLFVAAFTRWDRATGEEGNTFDYLIDLAFALAMRPPVDEGVWAFDGATSAAVEALAPLPDEGVVVWQSGEQSTVDETFSRAEQQLLADWVARGGRVLASGSEIGWDLEARGDAEDGAFLRDVLGAVYVADDAGSYEAQGVEGTRFADFGTIRFDDGSAGIYDVDYPDVLDPAPGSRTVLRYADGRSAAVASDRAVLIGFPLEAVVDVDLRGRLVERGLEELGAPRLALGEVDPVDPIEPEDVGVAPDVGEDVAVPDAAPIPDGSPTDAGRPDSTDEGGFADAAEVGGEADAGPVADAPPRPRPDAGSLGPGGARTDVTVNEACGCSAAAPGAPGGHAALALLTWALVVRRRSRP